MEQLSVGLPIGGSVSFIAWRGRFYRGRAGGNDGILDFHLNPRCQLYGKEGFRLIAGSQMNLSIVQLVQGVSTTALHCETWDEFATVIFAHEVT